LVGGTDVGVGDYIEKLKKLALGENIEIIESPSFKEIKKLYGQAKIFWSAVGYGADEKKEPERVEHFGISLVEAMAGGAVPIVYSAGGYKEIVTDGDNGFLWSNLKKLRDTTNNIIEDRQLFENVARKAAEDAKIYEYERFRQEAASLL
jgi:glycosyltransferase involved in cell wall biosynthesis